MKKALLDRLRTLEFSIGRKRAPQGMDEVYEHFVQLGLGEVLPDDEIPAILRFQRGIAWAYRQMMVDFDRGAPEPKNDWERNILDRYRMRLSNGEIREFEFAEEDGIW